MAISVVGCGGSLCAVCAYDRRSSAALKFPLREHHAVENSDIDDNSERARYFANMAGQLRQDCSGIGDIDNRAVVLHVVCHLTGRAGNLDCPALSSWLKPMSGKRRPCTAQVGYRSMAATA